MADQACKSNNHSGVEGAYPGVALPSSNLEGTTEVGVPVLGVTENSATTIARGRAIKRVNAWTAVLCGGLPALALGILFPTGLQNWLASFLVGLLWASLFEYAYHRFLLHLPGTFFARRHLQHHASVGTPTEAEHVNFGSSPIWVVALFVINGIPVVAADLLFGLRIAPGVFLAFAIYFITVEEVHWRIHLGEWLPPVLEASRAYHLAHHARPDARFNIFLPLWDMLLGSMGK
jgi:Fatty acid hydroxylase